MLQKGVREMLTIVSRGSNTSLVIVSPWWGLVELRQQTDPDLGQIWSLWSGLVRAVSVTFHSRNDEKMADQVAALAALWLARVRGRAPPSVDTAVVIQTCLCVLSPFKLLAWCRHPWLLDCVTPWCCHICVAILRVVKSLTWHTITSRVKKADLASLPCDLLSVPVALSRVCPRFSGDWESSLHSL